MPDLSAASAAGPASSGRTASLELLTAVHTRSVQAHEGALVLITAPVGYQKSALLQEFAQRAGGLGTLVLRASADRSEQLLPFTVVEQLTGTNALSAAVRDELHELLDQIVWASPQPAQGPAELSIGPDNSGPLRRLCRLFEDLAAASPIAVLVDDIQDADRPSVELLLYLARRTRGLPLMMVLVERPELAPAHPDLQVRLAHEATDVLRPDAEPDPDHVRALPADWIALSGGNPALVEALIADRSSGGRWPGKAYDAAVSAWVHSQDPALVNVASVLATGIDVDRALLAKVLQVDRETADRALALLAEIGPLRPDEPLHPALRAAVLRSHTAERRAQLHADVARALYDNGADEQLVVDQLTAAGQPPEEWAFPLLWGAADRALSAARLSTAVDLLQLALRGSINDCQRAQTLVAFARIEWRNNPSGARRYYRRLVEAACAGHCDDSDLAAVVKFLLWHGAYAQGERVLNYWLDAVAAERREAGAELRSTLEWTEFAHFQVFQRLVGAKAIDTGEASTGAPRLVAIQAVRGAVEGGPAQPWIADAEQILRQTSLSDPSMAGTIEPLQAAILTLLHAGQLDLAATRSEELLARLAHVESCMWLARASSVRAEIAVRRGEPRVAMEHARRALDLIDHDGWGVMIGIPLACLVIGLSETGQHEEAAEALAIPVPDVLFESRPGLHYLQARAVAAAAQDRWSAALREHERCARIVQSYDCDLPAYLNWRVGAAEAQLRLNRPDLAEPLIRELLAMPGADVPGVRGPALRVLAATVRAPEKRLKMLAEAARLLADESGSRLELSRALEELSQTHRALGNAAQARTLALQATRRRTDCLEPIRPQAPRRPRGHSATSGGELAALSEAEHRVAALAAEGHSNQAVADALFITVSTVEQHLTRIYRKLHITRRRELMQRFRDAFKEPAHYGPPSRAQA
jgi:DNA-binding CsgD family transcriptional regulator